MFCSTEEFRKQTNNAALNSEDTPFYFFISKSENIYHYPETYEEHLALCAEAGLV